jgi:8-oxo-dGTP diphosphatase
MTVSAILRRGGDVLLVHERTRLGEMWALPGGVVEPQELAHDAVVREVQEETGLTVHSVARLVFLSQHLSALSTGFDPLTAFGFEISDWEGEVRVDAADEDVFEAEFVPCDVAVERLGLNTFAPSVEPARAYLCGAVPAGTTWMWSVSDDEQVELRHRLAP